MKKTVLLSLAASWLLPFSAIHAVEVQKLRCEYLEDPLGIDATKPRLNWVLEDGERGQKQTAYQILVASTPEILAKDQGDLWDSGRISSDQSIQVAYAGKPLESQAACHWKVRVWDKDGEVSDWSAPALWTMGLLKPEDWSAQWIGLDKAPDTPPTKRADLQDKGHKVVVKKALYGIAGDPTKQANITKNCRSKWTRVSFWSRQPMPLPERIPLRARKSLWNSSVSWRIGAPADRRRKIRPLI